MIELFLDRYVYFLVFALMAVGLWGMLVKGDLIKKVVGLTIFQSAIFLFFIEGSIKRDAATPVITDELGSDPAGYVDPIPHLLILTAIVVGVAVLGVALTLITRLYRAHGTLDEEVIAAELAGRAGHEPPESDRAPARGGGQ